MTLKAHRSTSKVQAFKGHRSSIRATFQIRQSPADHRSGRFTALRQRFLQEAAVERRRFLFFRHRADGGGVHYDAGGRGPVFEEGP